MFFTIIGVALVSSIISGIVTYYATRDTSNFKVQHKVRGTIYEVIASAVIQTEVPLVDYDKVFVYRDIVTGEVWARRDVEIDDGRFKIL